MTIPWWIKDFASIIFPDICPVCGRKLVEGENVMCLHCYMSMPRTGLHRSDFNSLHQRLGHKIAIERAAAYFHYERDSDYAELIYSAKYRSMPHIARELGAQYAREIAADGFFDGIDILEPVPLSFFRMMKRGYNQSEEIAKGISSVTGIAIGHHLRARHHSSQTRKNQYQRWENVGRAYYAKEVKRGSVSQPVPGHVLIIDDIITTGATMVSCAAALRVLYPEVRISILSLGATRLS